MTPTLSASNHYLLQQGLSDLHQQTIEWESDLALWREEFAFFEKLVAKYRKELRLRGELEDLDHIRFLLNYYSYDLASSLKDQIANHKSRLKSLMDLRTMQDESAYRAEHNELALKILTLEQEVVCFKNDLYNLLEKGLARNKKRLQDVIATMNRRDQRK